jgi:hypothetical protein
MREKNRRSAFTTFVLDDALFILLKLQILISASLKRRLEFFVVKSKSERGAGSETRRATTIR